MNQIENVLDTHVQYGINDVFTFIGSFLNINDSIIYPTEDNVRLITQETTT